MSAVFWLSAALTASNFVFEAVWKRQWGKALERSFFQAVAVGLSYVTFRS